MVKRSSQTSPVEPSTNCPFCSRLVTIVLGLGALASIVALTVFFVRAERPVTAIVSFATVITLLQVSILAAVFTIGEHRTRPHSSRGLIALLWVTGIGGATYALFSGLQILAVVWTACLVLVGLIRGGYVAFHKNASSFQAAALPACWVLMFAATSVSWFSYASMLAADRADRVAAQLASAERAAREAMPENQLKLAVSAGDVGKVDELLAGGVDVSADDGQSLLAAAVKAEKWDIATRLLEGGANPREANGLDLLEFALQKGQSDLARQLIDAGAADDMSLELGPRVIGFAMLCGEIEIVEILLEKASSHSTGLLQRGGLFAQAHTLFRSGAPVDPKALTARAARFEHFVRCLFDRGATPSQFEIHNLVLITVRHGSPEFVEFVFGKLDTSQLSGRLSPLKLAAERGDERILEIVRSALNRPDERRDHDRVESGLLNGVQAKDSKYVQLPPSVGASEPLRDQATGSGFNY